MSALPRCLSCGQRHMMEQPCPTAMQDNTPVQEARGGLPFPGHNRKARRRIAKDYGLFKDHGGEAWRRANNHMKDRRDGQHG